MTTRALDIANGNPEQSNSWSSVLAITVCAFVLVVSEFLPVSLLTPIVNDLGTTEGMAGQGIAISDAFAILANLFISSVAGSLNRKTLLLGLTAAVDMSGAIVALTPNYFVYMLGRALIGMVIGGLWSMSAATAIRLVSANDAPRALALVNGGNALAAVVAASLGAWLGTLIGWRGAFFYLVSVALMTLAWQWTTLPSMWAGARAPGPGNVFTVFALLKHPGAMLGMLASSLFFMGQSSLFTYVRPFLETVTGVHGAHISLILLVIGAAGFIGTLLIDRVLQRRFLQTLVAILLLMALIALVLMVLGGWPAIVVVLLGLWGLTGTSAPVGWWAWVTRVFLEDTETGGGLFVAVVQLSIVLDSTLGGLLLNRTGYQATFFASTVMLLIVAFLITLTARLKTPAGQTPGTPGRDSSRAAGRVVEPNPTTSI